MSDKVETTSASVQVTDKAAAEIKRLIKEENMPETAGLKVGVRGGGCSGLSYVMEFANDKTEGERIFLDKGIRLFVDLKSFLYIQGTTLDYSGGLNGKGFVFTNPNASKTCGCGESFAV